MESCNTLMQQKIKQSQISICAMAHVTIFKTIFNVSNYYSLNKNQACQSNLSVSSLKSQGILW